MQISEFPPELIEKLEFVRDELGASDISAALDKSLNIAHFVTGVLKDRDSKLLVERKGKYEQLTEFS